VVRLRFRRGVVYLFHRSAPLKWERRSSCQGFHDHVEAIAQRSISEDYTEGTEPVWLTSPRHKQTHKVHLGNHFRGETRLYCSNLAATRRACWIGELPMSTILPNLGRQQSADLR
jgi:hypothetical protein